MAQKSPKKPADARLFYISAMLIFSSLFLMGQFSRTVRKADDDQFWEFTAMFAEIYKEINDRYVEPVDSKKLFEGALQGMFLTLDPHSQFMDPDSYSQLEKDTEGSFSGIGIHIAIKDNILTVISPIPGSASAKAGIKPWDRIIEINGKKTEGIVLTDAVKKLTGPTGTTVDISVYREGESAPLHFTLTRQNVKIESVYSKVLEDHPEIGYARITKFSDNTSRDLRAAIDKFKEQNVQGLIIDLRYNTGGLLKEAQNVSNLFLPRGKMIVSTKGRTADQAKELRAENDPVTDLPLMILINKSSASASEILAGAIKDHKRGIIVGMKGQRSFGKGSVQTIEDLSHSFEKDEDGNYRPAAIRLTTAKYYTPSGISIDKIGITPDIAVEMPKDNELDLLRNGLYGDTSTNEDDGDTTSTVSFTWDEYNKENGKASEPAATETTDAEDDSTTATESDDISGLAGSAIINDDDTTGPQPLRIIPLDRDLFPDAEIAGEKKQQEQEEEAESEDKKSFVDYQLHVTTKLLQEWISTGNDPLQPAESDLKPDPKDWAKAASYY